MAKIWPSDKKQKSENYRFLISSLALNPTAYSLLYCARACTLMYSESSVETALLYVWPHIVKRQNFDQKALSKGVSPENAQRRPG